MRTFDSDSEISRIPVGETTELSYLPAWYVSAQAADSMLAYDDDHPLRDASLEMLGRVIVFAGCVAAIGGFILLAWWQA